MIIHTFTDPQGKKHTDAVVQVFLSNYNQNVNENYNVQLDTASIELAQQRLASVKAGEDPAMPDIGRQDINQNHNLNYKILYWTDEKALEDGHYPYILLNTENGTTDFFADNLSADYLGLSAEQKAEKHAVENVLVE